MALNNGLPSIVKSVQRGVINMASNVSSGTATITAVNISKTVVLLDGGIDSSNSQVSIELTNNVTVTAFRNPSVLNTSQVRYQVIEYV